MSEERRKRDERKEREGSEGVKKERKERERGKEGERREWGSEEWRRGGSEGEGSTKGIETKREETREKAVSRCYDSLMCVHTVQRAVSRFRDSQCGGAPARKLLLGAMTVGCDD